MDNNKIPNLVREYVSALNDDEVKFLLMRLEQGFQGDTAEALTMLQQHEPMDNWLRSATDFQQFFRLLDAIYQQLDMESRRRNR